ncbi:MAG: hypothetical protein EXR99_08285 [Gemmataceae bacterium]|nr:hypothetical protein [Gemmataceae bacterium]
MTTQEQTPGIEGQLVNLRLALARFSEKHGKLLVAVCIAIILLVAIYLTMSFISGGSAAEDSNRWVTLDGLNQSASLQAFADNNKGTKQGLVARLEAARILLAQGLTQFAATTEESKKESVNSLEKAIELLTGLLGQTDPYLELKAQTLWNLGKAHEARKRLDKAKDFYTQAAALENTTAAGKLAAKQLKSLQENQASVTDLYKVFE